MTSSFGNIIGTPRDQIPKLPVSNYANSAPDLTESAEERNQKHTEDLNDFFASVTEIETLRHNNLWDNIEGMVSFSSAAATLYQKRAADKESRETIKRFKNISSEELLRLNDKFTDLSKLEKAARINELKKLVREGNPTEKKIALDLLNQNVLPTGQEISFKNASDKFNRLIPSTFNSVVEKNYLISQPTFADAELVGENAVRDILTDIYFELNQAGFDINSRQVQNYINTKVLPSLIKENTNQLNSWKTTRPQIVQQNIARDNKAMVVDTFTRRAEITNDQGIKEVKNTGDFSSLIDYLILSNATVTNPGQAVAFMIDLINNNPNVKNAIRIEDVEYFLNDAKIIDHSQNKKEVNGFLNTKVKNVVAAERFFMKFKSDIADTNSEVYSDIKKVMQTEVRGFLAENNQDRLLPGQQLHFITKFNNELRRRGLSTNLPVPGFLQGDETIESKWSYADNVAAVGSINRREWEAAYRTAKGGKDLPLTIGSQIDKAKADLTRQVLEAKSKNPDANIIDLVDEFYPAILDKLTNDGYVNEVDKLRPLLPEDRDAEITLLTNDVDKWMNNKEVNSVYEKRYLDRYIEDYMKKGFLPSNIPDYIKKLATAANKTAHQYVMDRVKALGVYDEKTMKFVSDKNPEDIFNLNEKELQYLFVKPRASKNILLYSNKEGGLNGPQAKEALLALRQKGREVDSYEGRGFFRKIGAFIGAGPQNITVERAYNLAESGEGTNFGLYGISGKDLMRLVDAGILDRNATFDENTQDFAAFGLMYLQANDSNGIMGANIVDGVDVGVLDWKRLTGLSEADQATVLQFFPNLKNMPMSQFQNLQADVSAAILNEIETYQKDLATYLEKNPDKTQEDFDDLGESEEQRRRAATRSLFTGSPL